MRSDEASGTGPPMGRREDDAEPAVLVAVARAVHLVHWDDEGVCPSTLGPSGLEQVKELRVQRDGPLPPGLGHALWQCEDPPLPVDHPPFGFERLAFAECGDSLERQEASPCTAMPRSHPRPLFSSLP